MKLSDYIIDFFINENVGFIFEVCGGAITHLLDSIYNNKRINAVSMHHEQAAAFAAEGFARIKADIGAAMATSGPGATNLITGISSCFFDSVPCVFVTGQVNTYEFKFNKPIRQKGFQETDIVNIVRPVVKDAILATAPHKIRYYLERAVYIARTGRPGPVLLDIPMNVQRAEINPRLLKGYRPYSNKLRRIKPGVAILADIKKIMYASSRPVILAGGGVRLAKAEDELLGLVKRTGIPVVVSLMGIDALAHNHPVFSGMIGTYGNRYANLALANADFILALGTRLDSRQTGTRPQTFARGARIAYVDIEPNLDKKIKVGFTVKSDIKDFLSCFNKQISGYNKEKIQPWRDAVSGYKKKYPSWKMPVGPDIEPNFLMHKLSEFIPDGAVVCVDVGQNQMWAAQSIMLKKTQRFLTQGGLGAMGSALSMAIGASFADPSKVILVITGDGGFQLNIQELQTVSQHRLPIKIILLNNKCYGMVRQFQEQYFGSRFQSTVKGYSCPDFGSVVSAYKIPADKIRRHRDIPRAFKELFSNKRPGFLEIEITADTNVLPKLGVNKPIEEQDPALPRQELESSMFINSLKGRIK